MIRTIPLLFLLLLMSGWSVAQPVNNTCEKAFPLKNTNNWCSSPAQFTTHAATPSGISKAGCFPGYEIDTDNDVWFKFTAKGNQVNISVVGKVGPEPKGSLQFPQIALYRGSCGNLQEVRCISDAQGYHIVETFAGPLVLGETYLIRIDGRYSKTGSFQLCVNNFNEVPSSSSDCSTGVILCDKSPFTVPSIIGTGKVRDPLLGICVENESSSAWYKWTCGTSGTLTFTLKPVNPADDIDFALFLLPNGLQDCGVKMPLRCVASGEQVNAPYKSWAHCTGATGLRTNSTDTEEYAGCEWQDDNYAAAVQMRAGESYALLINNFHNTGNGFSIEFGGVGTFKGPQADFTTSARTGVVDKPVLFKNTSRFAGKVVKYKWNFGVGAKPATANGKGPHTVFYKKGGKKSISLTVETDRGCVVTKVKDFRVAAPQGSGEAVAPRKKQEAAPSPVQEETPPPLVVQPTSVAAESPPITTKPKPPVPTSPEEPTTIEVKEPSPPKSKPKEIVTTYIRNYEVQRVIILYFESDSFNIQDGHLDYLVEAKQWLDQNEGYIASVEGHTNNIPHNTYCEELAEKRAKATLDHLLAKGIEVQRVSDKFFGKSKPRSTNKSSWGRKRNQRVEIKILKPLD